MGMALGDFGVLAGGADPPAEVVVDFKEPVHFYALELGERDAAPFDVLILAGQDGKAREDILAVVFGNMAVGAADKEMLVNELVLKRLVFGGLEPGDLGQFVRRDLKNREMRLIGLIYLTRVQLVSSGEFLDPVK